FREFPEAIANTLHVGERCHLDLEFGSSKYPEYPVPAGKTREGYLRELCYQGLRARYGERATADSELARRLEYELGVLEKTGFVSYLLIVWVFIHFAKEKGIPVGLGRGSAAVSIVAFVLGRSYRDSNRIAKMIPNELNITLDGAVGKNAELKRAVTTEPATRQLFEHAKVLEGLSRNAGVHAAGVVIADRDLSDYIPLCH